MSLSADALLDRIHLKGQLTRWRVLALVFAVAAAYAFFGGVTSVPKQLGSPYIARVTFDSIMFDDRNMYDMLDEVAANRNVKAVIVWLDTPGGSAVAGEEIYLRLKEMSKQKPVVAVMRSVAASAGYLAAVGTDRIYARNGTITGSIGVIIETAEVTELAKKLGIQPITVKSGEFKGMLSPLDKASEQEIDIIQTLIDDFYHRFIDMVAEARGMDRNTVVKLADGRVYSGQRAKELGLIDAIGGESDAIAWLEAEKNIPKHLDIIDESANPPLSFLNRLSQSVFGKFFQNSRIKLDGLAAIWHPDLH